MRAAFSVAILALASCGAASEDEPIQIVQPSNNEPMEVEQSNDDGDFVPAYEGSQNERLSQLHDVFSEAQYLETLAAVGNGFALPFDVEISLTECGVTNAFYLRTNPSIFICLELIDHVVAAFNARGRLTSEQVGAATYHTMMFIGFHELGHALVDLLDLPITGREEDAVDDLSTIILVAAGRAEWALDAAIFWKIIDQGLYPPSELADEHSINLQRFYNVLCIVYGSAPNEYENILENFPEFASRAPRCEDEYNQKKESWERLLDPHFVGSEESE